MIRQFFILIFALVCLQTVSSQQFQYPFQTTIKWWIMSNPSGTDYLTHWIYRDSSASVVLENDTLEIITNSSALQKSPGHGSPDSTRVVIKVKIDRTKMITETRKTDNRDHDITGELFFKGQKYPIYGAWSFSEKSRPNNLYLDFSIGHKLGVRIPFKIDDLSIFELTDFLFEGIDAPVIMY